MKYINHRGYVACVLFLLLFGAVSVYRSCSSRSAYRCNEGFIFGTVYHMTYRHDTDLQPAVAGLLQRFDRSLSPFNPASVITAVNNNDTAVVPDDYFNTVFRRAKEIYKATGGAFDPTLSPLINAWGFGFGQEGEVTPAVVDSLLQFVGMDKISLSDGRVVKADPRLSLNFSAIAKGYACDVVAAFLEEQGVGDYLVEIGGEVVARGRNPRGEAWQVGIDRPLADGSGAAGGIECVVSIARGAVATSGNYRNYRYVGGRRVAHTIDPVSGSPVEHALLSATVIAPDCMTADAYATAFMVMGADRGMQLAAATPGIEAFFISAAEGDTARYDVVMTPGMESYLK